jgi:hypothetical protein
MTRAEAWLTAVGAVLALVPAALFGAVLWSEGDRGATAGLVPLLAMPSLLALAALALPERRPVRVALTMSAACLLLPISLLTYLLAFPALASITAATGTASSDGSAKGGLEWPLVAMIPVVVVFWLAALAVYLVDGTRRGCEGHQSCFELSGMIAIATLPAAFVLYLIRRDRPRAVPR